MEKDLNNLRRIADKALFDDPSHEQVVKKKLMTRVQNIESSPVIKSRKKLYLSFASIIVAFSIFGLSFVSPALANILQKLPIISFLYDDHQKDIGLEKAKEVGVADEYKKTIVSNDVELTITNTYYDGVNLSVGYELKNNTDKIWELPPKTPGSSLILTIPNYDIKLNGAKAYGGYGEDFDVKSDRSYEGILNIYPIEFPEGDKITLELSFSEIQGVKGEWSYKIPISKEKTKENVQSFSPDYTAKGLGGEITIKSVTFSPTGIELETETMVEKGMGQDILFSIKDVGADEGVSGHTELLDDGRELVINRSTFPPIKEIPDSITIKAYSMNDRSKSITFTVPLNK
ncbi:DUF4179 domain-containing protein [Pseudalkalibacillus caeni]|uniref:DUF4179 domain-containing protein n=1 Tax=Exobacillus caeni TaxID=2574798 RepID=A0A5R9F4H4_9BACL|nr:DUF4179 domain-containing protein [Pseudalkalibacillus caeni]TLS38592.1 DUF4179 domain-containing protein [Pseudalkalibacillus caeni]